MIAALSLAGCAQTRQPYTQGSRTAPRQDIDQATAHVARAVVRIDTTVTGRPGVLTGLLGPASPEEGAPVRGQGSGVIINSRRGYVLTNEHVVHGARDLRVTLSDGRSFRGKLLGADAMSDIAVIGIAGRRLPQAELGSSAALPVGSWVIAVGNPYGLNNTVTAGVLSAKGRIVAGDSGIPVTDLLQTDAAINEGNSGGALIDLQGQLVGLPTAIVPFAHGIGFAVAIDTVKYHLTELLRTGKVAHAWLGIAYVSNPTQPGVVIQDVRSGPARQAGLRAGDIITALDNRPVADSDDLMRIIRAKRPGDKLIIAFKRGGASKRVTVRLAVAPQAR